MIKSNHQILNYIELILAGILPLLFISNLTLLIIACLIPINYIWLIPYIIYIYFDKAPESGGRRIKLICQNFLWSSWIKYFNITLVKDCDLSSEDNYLFGYHPHGIWGYGYQTLFNPYNSQFKSLFPGIDPRPVTISSNFRPPFHRDIVLGMGFCSCTKESINYLLTRNGPGSSCVVMPGGGAEALLAQDHKAELVLKNRLGFCKLAIEAGATLVPVYSFGETSAYTLISPQNNYWFDKIQEICSYGGFRLPIWYGRGFKNNSIGIFPYKSRITVVVGEPIKTLKNLKPSKLEIEKVHSEYCEALIRLYDKYKERYHVGPLPIPELKLV